jgi:hypothetical protein
VALSCIPGVPVYIWKTLRLPSYSWSYTWESLARDLWHTRLQVLQLPHLDKLRQCRLQFHPSSFFFERGLLVY